MHPKRPLLALPLLAALLTATLAGPAGAADPESRVKGRLRFHVDTDFLGWTHGREFNDKDFDPGPDYEPYKLNRVGFGFARPLAGDTASAGVGDLDSFILSTGGSMFGLGLGYGVHKHIILGARMGMSFDHVSSPSENEGDAKSSLNYFSTVFTPYLEVLPLTTGRVLPFFMFRTGFSASALALSPERRPLQLARPHQHHRPDRRHRRRHPRLHHRQLLARRQPDVRLPVVLRQVAVAQQRDRDHRRDRLGARRLAVVHARRRGRLLGVVPVAGQCRHGRPPDSAATIGAWLSLAWSMKPSSPRVTSMRKNH